MRTIMKRYDMRERCMLLTGLLLLANSGLTQTLTVTVENPSRFERKSETIAISLEQIVAKLPAADADKLVVAESKGGKILLSQVCEGELLFQSDFRARERKSFLINQSHDTPSIMQSFVDGRFVLPREDYAWENDRIAFRMYGPALAKDVNNGIDVWTKRVRSLIVGKWYKESEGAPPGKDTYHEDRGEGADLFSVGKTLGGGGSGIWLDGKLHQPGVFSSQRTIANGPIRVVFELTYDGWDIAERRLREVKRISLDAGSNLNRIHVTLQGLDPNDSLLVACGVVKRANTTFSNNSKNAWVSLWGLTTADSVNGYLGTGIIVPQSRFAGFAEDNNHYLALGTLDAQATFVYYSGAGWTRSGDFANEKNWKEYLDLYTQRLRTPLKIIITTKR
jgi:hypothetical protein